MPCRPLGSHGSSGSLPANRSVSVLVFCLVAWMLVRETQANGTSITDNTCVFRDEGRLFTLTGLNKIAEAQQYEITIDAHTSILFNFCDPFLPSQCAHQQAKAYSFLVKKTDQEFYDCTPYSSDSKTHNFSPQYLKEKGEIRLNLSMATKPGDLPRATDFILDCQESAETLEVRSGQVRQERLVIYGSSTHACPLFEISSLWRAIGENLAIFGSIMLVVGFVMLFFGVLMTHLMIFIAAYFLSFGALALLASTFLRPDSTTLTIYFALLAILFLSTLIAYALTRLVRVSLFFIGAFLGFILAAILNSIFCKLSGVYSVWSLIGLEIALTVPLGLLTFKYSEQVIVVSTSLAGAYMIVRPFSWLIGGFPNEFTLYLMIENGQIETLPWSFFIYILVIALLALVGALYQLLKIKRRDPNAQVQTNFITAGVETRVDRIKEAVERMMALYAPEKEEEYKQLQEMEEIKKSGIRIEEGEAVRERKSRQQNF